MRFTTQRQTLANAAAFVARVVRANPDRPALANIKFEVKGARMRLTASSGETSLETVIAITDGADGVTLVPAKRIVQVLSGLDGETVTASTVDDDGADTGEVTLHSNGATVALRTMGSEGFPDLGALPEHQVTLDAAAFTEALAQVLPAASSDASRPALTGVLLAATEDGLRLVATDSYRLVIRDVVGASVLADGQTVLVPSTALGEVSRLGDVDGELSLHLGDNEVVFSAGHNRMRTRLLSAEYPDVERLIPVNTPKRTAVVDRSELAAAVKLAGVMAIGSAPVRLAFEGDEVTVAAYTDEVGRIDKKVPAKLDGSAVEVAFNHEYVQVALATFPGDEVRVEMNEAAQPVILRDDTVPSLVYLVMPIRAAG